MENKWMNNNRGATGRVPESVFNAQFIGMNCSGDQCAVVFCAVKEMFSCKGVTFPVGITKALVNRIMEEFKDKGLQMTDGCDNKQRL